MMPMLMVMQMQQKVQ
jgi:hypothetical protein